MRLKERSMSSLDPEAPSASPVERSGVLLPSPSISWCASQGTKPFLANQPTNPSGTPHTTQFSCAPSVQEVGYFLHTSW